MAKGITPHKSVRCRWVASESLTPTIVHEALLGQRERRGAAVAGRHNQFGFHLAGDLPGPPDHGLGDRQQAGGRDCARGQQWPVAIHFFGGQGNLVHHFDRFARVVADRGLAGEHAGVAAVEDRVGDVGDFRPGGPARILHALQHLRGDDHRLLQMLAGGDDLLLHHRHPSHVDFHSQVAAGHHDAVGRRYDLVQLFEGFGLFDLGDYPGRRFAVEQKRLELADVGGLPDEAQADEVDAVGRGPGGVLAVAIVHGRALSLAPGKFRPWRLRITPG